MLDVEMAKLELSRKTMNEIQKETAWKWASRAVAAFELSLTKDAGNKICHFFDGKEFMSESLEHAAQVSSELVKEIDLAINKSFVHALVSLGDLRLKKEGDNV